MCKKTNIQILGSGDPATDIGLTVEDNTVKAVTEFRYLGSIQSSSGRCYADIQRRIGVAYSAMQRCWLGLLATPGAAKAWYCIPPQHGEKFERLAASKF